MSSFESDTMKLNNKESVIDAKRKLDVGPGSILDKIQQSIAEDIMEDVENTNKLAEYPVDKHTIQSSEFIIGIDLSKSPTTCLLLNLDGDVELVDYLADYIGEDAIVNDFPEAINGFLKKHDIKREQIKWLSVGLPGEMNEEHTVISYSYYLQITNLPLKDILVEKLEFPVTLMNDLEAAVYAESVVKKQKYHTLAYVLIDKGVGTSFIFHHEFYRGANGGAGKMYQLGRYGAELTYNDLITNYPGLFAHLTLYDALDKYVEMGLNGTNPELRDKLEYMIDHIATYFASVLQLLDIEKMIISGWLTRNEVFFKRLCSQIHYKELAVNNPTILEAPYWQDNGIAVGAAIMGLYQMKKLEEVE